MALAREHLRADGVFVQWMNVAFLDEALLRSLTATLLEVFGQVRIYRPDPATLVFLAAREPLALEQRVAASGMPLALAPAHYARFGINCAEDLIAALAVDEDGARRLAAGAELITDDNNRMATSSVFELGRGLGNEAAGRVLAEFDPLVNGAPWLYAGLAGRFDPGYVARRQLFFRSLDASVPDRVAALARNLGETSAARYVRVLLLASRGDVAAAVQLARESLVAYPGAASLAYASLQPSLGAIARGEVDAAQQAAIAALPRSGQAAIRGAQLLVQGQFAQLAELDPLLAEAAWTDAWYFDALQLRSEWRSRVSNPDLARRYSDQAIGFADRATFIQPSLPLFAVRARAAINADRPDVLLESVASVVQWTVAGANGASPQSRARARSTLQEVRGLLSGRDSDPRIDRLRLEEVRARVDEAIASLN
ncbi:MAG: hypothetical protein U1F11_14225, partial [Steroidobacteraceae bacterium]